MWLGDGALPILDYQGEWHYLAGEDDQPETHHWSPATSRSKLITPLLSMTYEQFLQFLTRPMPERVPGRPDETLFIALRSSYVAPHPLHPEGVRYLILGAGILYGEAEGALPIHWRSGRPSIIEPFCTLNEAEEPPSEALLLPMWTKLREQREEDRLARLKYEEAKGRARRLLLAHLDDAQRAELDEKKRFHVRGQDGHLYLIMPDYHGNIYRMEDGKPTVAYCIVVADSVPLFDSMLGQKLLLETDIEAFLEIANAKDCRPED